PTIVGGRKRWKDTYERLAPADQFESAKQVEKQYGTRIRELLGDARPMASGPMQLVTDFVDQGFFTRRQNDLRPSTLAGYKDFYYRELEPHFKNLRMFEIRLPEAQRILDRIAREKPHASPGMLGHLKWLGVSIFKYAAQHGAFDADRKNPFSEVSIPRTMHVRKPARLATLDNIVAMLNALDEPAA